MSFKICVFVFQLMVALLAAVVLLFASESSALSDPQYVYGYNRLHLPYGNGYYKEMPHAYTYNYHTGYGPAAYIYRW